MGSCGICLAVLIPKTCRRSAIVSPFCLSVELCDTYACVNHEAQDILYAIESQDTSVDPFPQSLVIRIVTLYRRSQLVYIFRIGDGNFKKSCFRIALKAEEVLPHYHLHGLYGRLMLGKVAVKVGLEAFAICFEERDRGGDVKIMEKVGDMKEYRVAGLPSRELSALPVSYEGHRRELPQ